MSENILDYANFSEPEYQTAMEILCEIAPGNFAHPTDNISNLQGKDLDKSFNGSYAAHPQYWKCNFHETIFDGINGIASNILDCCFYGAKFKDAGMAFSDFSDTHFLDKTTLLNCGFTECSFVNTEFANVFADGSVFDRSFFIDTPIIDTEFLHCSFEDVVFRNTHFQSCDLIHANLEYSEWQDIKLDNVNLPFRGVLRAFGGLQAVRDQLNITIQYSDTARRLTVEQFMEILPSIQAYFFRRKDFFPLANINIVLGDQKKALYYILLGLQNGLEQRDFRMIRYLCKLASRNSFFTARELRQLFDALVTNSQIGSMSNHQYQLYLREIAEIKRLLIDNPFSRPQMVITCTTSLDSQDYEGLMVLLQFFEQTLQRELPQCSYYYSVRRNSPPVLEFFTSDILPNLYYFVNMIALAAFGVSSSVIAFDKIVTLRGKQLENRYSKMSLEARAEHNKLDNELKREQIQTQRLQNQMLSIQLKGMKKNHNAVSSAEGAQLPPQVQGNIRTIGFSIQTSEPDSVPVREHTFSAT